MANNKVKQQKVVSPITTTPVHKREPGLSKKRKTKNDQLVKLITSGTTKERREFLMKDHNITKARANDLARRSIK